VSNISDTVTAPRWQKSPTEATAIEELPYCRINKFILKKKQECLLATGTLIGLSITEE